MIEQLRQGQGFPVSPMCRALDVSKSGYYAWKNRKPSSRRLEDERLKVAIRAAHERGRGTYGPEKIQEELAEVENIKTGINRIKRLRRALKIRCKQVRKFKATTDSKHNLPVAPNLLDKISRFQDRIKSGLPTSPTSILNRVGCIWLGSRIFGTKRSSGMP